MKMKKSGNIIEHSFGTLVDVTLGGAAMQAVSNSSMSQGLKDVTNLGIGVGIAGRALGRTKRSMKGSRWL